MSAIPTLIATALWLVAAYIWLPIMMQSTTYWPMVIFGSAVLLQILVHLWWKGREA